MARPGVDVVLFDLGGVLVDFGGVGPMRALAHIDTDEELWRRWLTCPWVRTFERGQCTPEAFAAGMVDEWGLEVSPGDYLAAFRDWPGRALAGAAELLKQVRPLVPTGCLSNTNALHWEAHFGRWPMLSDFDHRFLSFEMGLVKPDPEVFDHVAATLAVAPGRVLFLDDNAINVEAARSCGLRSERVRGVDEARRALVAAGVLTA